MHKPEPDASIHDAKDEKPAASLNRRARRAKQSVERRTRRTIPDENVRMVDKGSNGDLSRDHTKPLYQGLNHGKAK
jgi:hypothetical protein